MDTSPIAPPPERLAAVLDGTRRPFVTLKAAATLDGRIATRDGESQWITGEAARRHAMRLRAGHDAVLVGRGTVLADDPRLTVRLDAGPQRGGAQPAGQPARVVLDSLARSDPAARLFAADGARRFLVAGCDAPEARLAALRTAGVAVLRCVTPRPEPAEYLPALRAAGIRALLVEGGAEVHGNLIAQRTADALFLYLAGCVIGDRAAPAWCGQLDVLRLEQAPRLTLAPPLALDGDVLVHGWFEPTPGC